MIQTKKLLGTSTVTLTVNTTPADATCDLTYNGKTYENTKTAIVPVGTTISYSIYHSTYGTTTGSITMDKNKTLTCNGTYSTYDGDGASWSSPTNMSSNTSSSFKITPSGEYSSNYAWKAFDGNTTSASSSWCPAANFNVQNAYLILNTPTKYVRITKVTIQNSLGTSSSTQSVKQSSLYAANSATDIQSNNKSTLIGTGSNSNFTKGAFWSFNCTNSNYYNYFRLTFVDSGSSSGYLYIPSISLTGYEKTTAYNYYWDKTIS